MSTSPITSLYVAGATVTGGREGRGSTDDGQLAVDLRIPTELGGPGGGTNPEQLFAVGYAACFQSAMAVVARKERLELAGSVVRSDVTLGVGPAGRYHLAVSLSVSVAGLERDTVRRLVQEVDAVCPHSNAIRHNVDVTFIVE